MPPCDRVVAKPETAPAPAPGGGAGRSRRQTKWGAGVAASVLLHAVPLVIMGGFLASRQAPPMPPEVVFEVELVRLQAPPRPPSEKPPGPVQDEAPAQQAMPKPRLQPRIQTSATADVEPLPAPPPDPQVAVASQSVPAPETTAPPSRPAPPASSAATTARTWEGLLLAHLEQRKRYPAEARARRLQGVAYVRFSMDRQGRVLSAELERSSGHPTLDREAVALLRRAQPLPKPPPEVTGAHISLSVPIEFFIRGR